MDGLAKFGMILKTPLYQPNNEIEILVKTYWIDSSSRSHSYETRVSLVTLEGATLLKKWPHKYISRPDKKEEDSYPREAEIYAREIAHEKGLSSITIIPPEEVLPIWVSIDSNVALDKDRIHYYKRLWVWSESGIIRLQEPDSVIEEIKKGGEQRPHIPCPNYFYRYDSPQKETEKRDFINKHKGHSMYKNMEKDLTHLYTAQKIAPNGYFLTWDTDLLKKKTSYKTFKPKDFFEKFTLIM